MLKPTLLRYRVITYVVGTLLIVLTIGTIIKYTGGTDQIVAVVGMLHGFLYIVYLVLTADVARRAHFSLGYTILVMLSGTVPVMSFVAERAVTKRVRAQIRQREQEVLAQAR
jgi:integral membrane protein